MASVNSRRNGSADRAVLYLRMSDDEQVQSIPSQRAELVKLAQSNSYQVVNETGYCDEGISGDDTERRKAFLKMREDAGRGEFDVILCWDQDRFGRFDPLDAGYWIYPFRQAGVRLETIAQGKIDWEDLTGQLIYSVNQLAKNAFLKDLSRNTTRGLLAAAREGRAGTGGPNPYGYHSKDGVVTVVPNEAEVVRWIFQEYLKPGASLRGLAGELNRREIPPPRGKVWRTSSVRAILEREKYTGTFIYGRRNAGKYFAWRDGEIIPRRKTDKSVASDPIVHRDKFEAIVDRKIFDRVQAKLVQRKTNTAPKKARQYLLTGLVHCGDCGGTMGGVMQGRRPFYKCRVYHQSGAAVCFCNTIPEQPLVSVVAKKIQDRYVSEPALARLRRKIEAKLTENDRQPSRGELDRLRRDIESLDQKISRAADRLLEVPDDLLPVVYGKLDRLRSERTRLHAELDTLTSRKSQPGRRSGSEVDQVMEALRELGRALNDASPADTKRLLASIVSKIELHFTEGTGKQKRDFTHGEIHVRPDAGENRGPEPDPKDAHLITKGWFYATLGARHASPRPCRYFSS